MNVWRLVAKEIGHRKINFGLAIVSVAVAVAVLVAELSLLEHHDRNTGQIMTALKEKTQRRVDKFHADEAKSVAAMNEEFRKITKGLGFNIFILPKDQDLTDFYSEGYATKFMPESYVTKLAQNKIVTVRHLLPILEQKVKWPEQGDRKILLVGTRGEVPTVGESAKKPILDLVPRDKIVLGHELWNIASVKDGDELTLLGRKFTVQKRHNERGTKDDITAWINLQQAQEMLGLEGKVNAILALECSCAWADLPKVRAEIAQILPDTTVRETRSTALARAESRMRVTNEGTQRVRRAEQEAAEAIRQERQGHDRHRGEIEGFAAVIVPLVLTGAAVWIALLTYLNVRQRRGEVGILRAIGARSRQVAWLFLGRALIVGLVGGALGCAVGLAVSAVTAEPPPGVQADLIVLQPLVLLAALLAAPLLSALASWAPAMLAAWQDPAVVLREE